ncbi:MAG: hypothetical protein KDD60_11090, partial [Bdellovibrionales bacterium]|nr:hypothetical protein [Bdellovibrionales bacterium]
MLSLRNIAKRVLTRFFHLMPVPTSFVKIAKSQSLPIIVTQSNSIVLDALLTSFAERCGCYLCSVRSYLSADRKKDALCAVNIHNNDEIAELVKANGRKLYFSTLNIFRGKGPVRSHPSYSMKFTDYLAILLGPLHIGRELLIVFGEPVRLPDFEHPTANKICRRFKLDYYGNLKLVRGTPFQKLSIQEQIVLGGKDYERTLEKLAKSLSTTPKRLHRAAQLAFRKIAARPRAWVFIPAAVIARFILRRLFTAVEVRGLERFASALKKDTVVLVPMHRSHLDYVLIGSV